jgi:hypothetical protein
MRSSTLICIRWKLTGRIEIYNNLGKLYSTYSTNNLGVSRGTLDRKNLFEGYQNDTVEIYKMRIK